MTWTGTSLRARGGASAAPIPSSALLQQIVEEIRLTNSTFRFPFRKKNKMSILKRKKIFWRLSYSDFNNPRIKNTCNIIIIESEKGIDYDWWTDWLTLPQRGKDRGIEEGTSSFLVYCQIRYSKCSEVLYGHLKMTRGRMIEISREGERKR